MRVLAMLRHGIGWLVVKVIAMVVVKVVCARRGGSMRLRSGRW